VTRVRALSLFGVALACAVLPRDACGHDGPEQVIAALTEAIERRGPSAELLFRRASERRVLGDLAAAEDDLVAAVDRDPAHFSAGLELARVRAARGKHAAASVALAATEPFAESAAEQAACRLLRCDLHRQAGDVERALAECDAACLLVPREAEWLLLRSRLQAALGRHHDRLRDLAAAGRANPSAAIAVELVEAQIDAGRYAEALAEIEPALDQSRWRASWLLRRADLRSAVDEIDARLDPAHPDVSLLAERGIALALLGETAAAREDLALAVAHGADAAMVRRLHATLARSRP
jgi:tetratricopeptide (TPR) repeat protein